MKIFTYNENIEDLEDQSELLNLWSDSWSSQGFEPIILGRADAEKHDYFETFVQEMENIHLDLIGEELSEYGLSCYVRWLAYATRTEDKFYVSDVDVINNGFSVREPEDQLHLMDDCCPCFASGSPKQFEDLCKYFVSYSKHADIKLDIKLDSDSEYTCFHDQDFFCCKCNKKREDKSRMSFLLETGIKMTRDRHRIGIGNFYQVDVKNKAQVLHFSHTCMDKIKKENEKYNGISEQKLRVLLIKNLILKRGYE